MAALTRTLLSETCGSDEADDAYVSKALDTLRALRAAAVEDNISELDDVLARRPGLREDFSTLFAAVLPETTRKPALSLPQQKQTRRVPSPPRS